MDNKSKLTFLCAQIVRVSIGRRPAAPALLEEISREGASILVSCQARKFSKIKIDCSTCELRGRVVQCTRVGENYVAEVAFSAFSPWSPERFRPDCLLNPNFFVCKEAGCRSDCTGACVDATESALSEAGPANRFLASGRELARAAHFRPVPSPHGPGSDHHSRHTLRRGIGPQQARLLVGDLRVD